MYPWGDQELISGQPPENPEKKTLQHLAPPPDQPLRVLDTLLDEYLAHCRRHPAPRRRRAPQVGAAVSVLVDHLDADLVGVLVSVVACPQHGAILASVGVPDRLEPGGDLVQQVGFAHDRAPVDVDDKASEIVGGRGQVGEGVPAEALVWHPDGAPVDVAELGEVQAHLFDDHLRVLNQEKICMYVWRTMRYGKRVMAVI